MVNLYSNLREVMRIVIIEDEARIARRIERLTRELLGSQVQAIAICESVNDGLSFIQTNPVDVLLLDLNLNGEDGFALLKTVISESFHTIIISAYTEKAITAFSYGVLDFVPKPFDEARLAQAFLRLTTTQKSTQHGTQFLAIKKNGAVALINIEEVKYIKGAGIYTELHLKNGKREIHDKTLEKLEQLLPGTFERIHKSYIIPVDQAQEIIIHSGSKYYVVLKTGEVLPIGRTRYKNLKNKLFNPPG